MTLEVANLTVAFHRREGEVHALTDASFQLGPGEILVVVGESGSGKTVLAHALMRLLPANCSVRGKVCLDDIDLLKLSEREMRAIRSKRVSLIPQSPGTALNPVRKLGSLMTESAMAKGFDLAQAKARLTHQLDQVGMKFEHIAGMYAHQLSGGMQQRVVNTIALLGDPKLVIADEPTYGLDSELVEVTAFQLSSIAERGAALIVITHDLRLAERLGGSLALVYGSYIVENVPTNEFFACPQHPYGRALLSALPERGMIPIPGTAPDLTDVSSKCPFESRCTDRMAVCKTCVPRVVSIPSSDGWVRCHKYA